MTPGADLAQRIWGRGGPHGERGARAYNGGLGAMPPVGSRGKAPGWGSGGQAP
jgi:hypothetical protein